MIDLGDAIYITGWRWSQLAMRRTGDFVHYWIKPNCPSNSVWFVPGTWLED